MTQPPDNQPPEGPQVRLDNIRLDKDANGVSNSAAASRRPYVGQSAPFDETSRPFKPAGTNPADANPAGGATWAQPSTPGSTPPAADAGTRKLVAALLAIFLGTLGLHKFYLGYTGAGLVLLLVNLGGWFVTFLLSVITLGIASIFLIPLMTLVSSVIAICTIIEGVVYLSKTDSDFYQTYIAGRREWF